MLICICLCAFRGGGKQRIKKRHTVLSYWMSEVCAALNEDVVEALSLLFGVGVYGHGMHTADMLAHSSLRKRSKSVRFARASVVSVGFRSGLSAQDS